MWLVLAPCREDGPKYQVRSVVYNHEHLFEWGAATVLQLCDNNGQPYAPCLCVEGRWSAVDEQMSQSSAPSKWTQIGKRDSTPLYFGQLDEPVAGARQLLTFASPVLEDSTHTSTFYFESVDAWRQAAEALGVVPHDCPHA